MGNSKAIHHPDKLHVEHHYIHPKPNTTPDKKLSLRQLNLEEDWPTIRNWISYYTGFKELRVIQENIHQTFENMLACDFNVTLMCVMNNIPICQVELFQYLCNEPYSPIECLPGDSGLRLLNNPAIRNHKQTITSVLELSLQYAFSLQQVERVICECNTEDEVLKHSLTDSGFDLLNTTQLPFYQVDLFTVVRAGYQKTKGKI